MHKHKGIWIRLALVCISICVPTPPLITSVSENNCNKELQFHRLHCSKRAAPAARVQLSWRHNYYTQLWLCTCSAVRSDISSMMMYYGHKGDQWLIYGSHIEADLIKSFNKTRVCVTVPQRREVGQRVRGTGLVRLLSLWRTELGDGLSSCHPPDISCLSQCTVCTLSFWEY